MQTEQHSKAIQHRGTVKFFIPKRGFGFITPEVGHEDIFMHATNIRSDKPLKPNDKVVYFIKPSQKDPSKPQAVGVRLLINGTPK